MSYARFIDNDVYVYLDCGGYLTCCGCNMQEREWVDEPNGIVGGYFKSVGERIPSQFYTTAEMIEHLDAHRAKGDHIENYCYDGLRAEAEENDKWIEDFAAGRIAE